MLFLLSSIVAAIVTGQIVQDGIDEKVFDLIEQILRIKYPGNEEKVLCMTEDFKKNKIVDRFYVKDLLTDLKQLEKDIEPYIENAEANCKVQSDPNGSISLPIIGLIIGISLILVVIFAFVGRKLMKKKSNELELS